MIYRQIHAYDCGVIVLQKLYHHFFMKEIPLSVIKSNVNYDENGINLLELKSISQKIGLELVSMKGSFDSFKKIQLKQPIITIIKSNEIYFHYVVVEKILKDKIIVFDPLVGKWKIKIQDFEKIYTNIIVSVTKASSKLPNSFSTIQLFENKFLKETILSSLFSIFLTIVSFVSVFYLKIVIDQIIPTHNKSSFLLVTALFVIVMWFKLLIDKINELITNKLELKYQLNFLTSYIQKMSVINWVKISNFDESTHLKNVELFLKISNFKSKFFSNFLNQGFSLFCSVIILLLLDMKLFLILFASSTILILITFMFKNKFKNIENENLFLSTELKKHFLNIINGIKQYRMDDWNNNFQEKFINSLENSIQIQIKFLNLSTFFSFMLLLIKSFIPYLIITFSVFRIFNNNLTLGEMMMFLTISNFFMDPISSFSTLLTDIPIYKQYTDNINAFFTLENEISNNLKNNIDHIKEIKIKNLIFKYSEGKQILNIKNLAINKNLHIIGPNGSGKTTLMKIISTLITSDCILFNDNLEKFYDIKSLRKQICFISNNDYLPYGTIYEYLTSSSDEKSKNLLIKNIKKYQLHFLLDKVDLSFHFKIEENGKNLSSGQKQLILLLKIFTSKYSVILLDEAFENIDEFIAIEIKNKLKKYLNSNQIVIEISHRNNYLFLDSEKFYFGNNKQT